MFSHDIIGKNNWAYAVDKVGELRLPMDSHKFGVYFIWAHRYSMDKLLIESYFSKKKNCCKR